MLAGNRGVNFLVTVEYDRLYPTDDTYSLRRLLVTFIPTLVLAEIFRRRIKKRRNAEK